MRRQTHSRSALGLKLPFWRENSGSRDVRIKTIGGAVFIASRATWMNDEGFKLKGVRVFHAIFKRLQNRSSHISRRRLRVVLRGQRVLLALLASVGLKPWLAT
jgi:hypothetical protein